MAAHEGVARIRQAPPAAASSTRSETDASSVPDAGYSIYEILSIEPVFGGANTGITHQRTRSRGAGASMDVDDTSSEDDGDWSAGSDGDSDSP